MAGLYSRAEEGRAKGCCVQVRELLKDHIDLVELLNAQFSKEDLRDNDLRQALYRSPSMKP
jgi:hypothetical protein